MLTPKGRTKVASVANGRAGISPEDYKSVAQGVVANFGTWSFDEASKTFTRHVQGALFPNAEAAEGNGTISVNGDEAKSVGPILGNATWRRAK
jgi:hypothetical protein